MAGSLIHSPEANTSDEDALILRSLMSTKEAANVIVPDDISANDLVRYLSVTARAISRAEDALKRLKPFLGRLLLVVKRRSLWKDLGYATYDEWMTRGVSDLYGISRSDAFACVRIAEQLGFLTPEKLEELGFSKLSVLATAIRKSTSDDMPVEMREEKTALWVKAAEEHSVRDLKELVVARGYAEKGELDAKVLVSILVSPAVKERWEAFVENPSIRQHCDTEDAGRIFELLLSECETEWVAQTVDALRG